jgi:5'-3' exonuclease
MSNSKFTLIIDGNWLLMSRMSTLIGKYATEKNMMKDLSLLMIKSINVVLRTFPSIDNVMFVSDGGSWRNKIDIPDFLSKDGVEYKGNRIKSADIDWNTIFSEYEEFINKLRLSGINVYKEPGIEGDDWCWYWSNTLNNAGTNVVIWSKDRDLTQLVKTDKNGCFTAWWNKENGVIFEEHSNDHVDFLMNPYYVINSKFSNELRNKATKSSTINPNAVVVDKIIRGDAGDNILPIILRDAKNPSKKKFKVATKNLNFELNVQNDDDVKNYLYNLVNSKNYINRINKSYEDIVEHFKYNRQLVLLQESSYPDYILSTLNSYSTYTCNKDISVVEQKIQAEKNEIDTLLDSII